MLNVGTMTSYRPVTVIMEDINRISEQRRSLWNSRVQAIKDAYPCPIGESYDYKKATHECEQRLKDLWRELRQARAWRDRFDD